MEWRFILAAIGIALLDIVLSGDNALVIAAAASRLPGARRLIAILWGGVAAIIFRVVLTAAATEILRVPLLQAIGGVLLIAIAIHVLPASDDGASQRRSASDRFFTAVVTILIADATMSLDNILAVAALAHGNIALIVAGLLFSMAVLFTASAFIARLMDALPWLIDLAALIIAYTAADLFVADPIVRRYLHFDSTASLAIHLGAVVFVLAVDDFLRIRARRRAAAAVAAERAGAPRDAPRSRATHDTYQPGMNGGTPPGTSAEVPGERRTEETPAPASGGEPPRS